MANNEVVKEYASVTELETKTGISKWTWRSWAYKGQLESVRVSNRLLIPLAEAERILEAGRRPRVIHKTN